MLRYTCASRGESAPKRGPWRSGVHHTRRGAGGDWQHWMAPMRSDDRHTRANATVGGPVGCNSRRNPTAAPRRPTAKQTPRKKRHEIAKTHEDVDVALDAHGGAVVAQGRDEPPTCKLLPHSNPLPAPFPPPQRQSKDPRAVASTTGALRGRPVVVGLRRRSAGAQVHCTGRRPLAGVDEMRDSVSARL